MKRICASFNVHESDVNDTHRSTNGTKTSALHFEFLGKLILLEYTLSFDLQYEFSLKTQTHQF